MSKRFTEDKKWRNEWFRTLPMKAKIVWTYLCDECEYYGVWKADYGLASFQVDFKFSSNDLLEWFGDKIHLFDKDKVLIIPFFEFQYGEAKDTWSSKVNARKKLENLGFTIINNTVQNPTVEDCGGTVSDSTPNVLIKEDIKEDIKVKDKINKGGVGENSEFLEAFAEFQNIPGVTKGQKAETRYLEQIKSPETHGELIKAISNYATMLKLPQNTFRSPKGTFEAFLGTKQSGFYWRDWVNWVNPGARASPQGGTVPFIPKADPALFKQGSGR